MESKSTPDDPQEALDRRLAGSARRRSHLARNRPRWENGFCWSVRSAFDGLTGSAGVVEVR